MTKTKIIHFPLDRGPTIHPEATLAVEVEEGSFSVAYSVCAKNDNFEKRRGRTIATHRLHNGYEYRGPSILRAVSDIVLAFNKINDRHPGTLSESTINDLRRLPEIVEKRNV